MNTDKRKMKELTQKIIGCIYEVSNTLGSGFLEKVYENALKEELLINNLKVEQQKEMQVLYKGKKVGKYVADLIVEDEVIIELKVVKTIEDVHIAQCLNYLKATNMKICLLVNYNKSKVELKRLVNNY